MITCPACGRVHPEVVGASAQVCPHCGHEASGFVPEAARAPLRVDAVSAAGRAFRLFVARWPLFVALWVPAVVVEVLAVLALLAYQEASGIVVEPGISVGDQMRILGVAIPLLLLQFAVQFALWAAVAAVAVGGEARDVLRRPGAPLALGAMLTMLWFAGALLLVVPFLVFFHWFMFAPAALASGERGLGRALEASRDLARRLRSFGFTALVLFVWLGVVLVGSAGAWLAGEAAQRAGVAPGLVAQVGGAVAAALVAPIVPLLAGSMWALAREGEAVAAPSEAPERRRTTRCPKCATLIPYAATGEPVDVVCPGCGHAGRVL